jgi:2-C-methyl-D-erythritol 4-phosphate cytidylyltransferase
MKMYAIIVAAGSGTRMKSDLPKQFLLLAGRPLYYYATQAFLQAYQDMEVILVVAPACPFTHDELRSCFELSSRVRVIAGGATRFESVKNGLAAIAEQGIVFIHDAVRPFINKAFLMHLQHEALAKGNAIPGIPVQDSLRRVLGEENRMVQRDEYKAIQTPQVFDVVKIKKAYEQPFNEAFTDDASVLEAAGHTINLVEGLRENIKITTPVDLKYAEWMMAG